MGYALRTDTYTPIFAIGDEDLETTIWQIWAEGFGHAVGLFSDAFETWLADDGDAGAAFRLVLLLTGLAMEDGEVEQGMDADEVVEMKAGAPDIIVAALYELYDARLKASGSLTPRRNTRVPGRNDPCPCGSGKKFKACCGSS